MKMLEKVLGRAVLTVFLKEVRENLRDRRTLISALLTGPLIGPLMLVLLMNITLNRQFEKAQKPLPVPVIGAEYAPNLINALKVAGVVPLPAIADPEQAVREQRADVVLRITPDYPEFWQKGQTTQVEVIFDSSQRDSSAAEVRVGTLVETYARQQGAMRLVARGLVPATASPVVASPRDQATAKARAALLFSVLPYFFVITIFMGGMYLAIDLTAGERERQSLEPLFANPVPRGKILAGKLMAIGAFSCTSLLISLTTFSIVGRFVPAEKLGMELDLGWHFAVQVLLIMLPLIALLGALQSMVAAFAKSYREAQTYLSLLMLVPMVPSLVLSILPFKPQDWMYAIPLLGQNLGIIRLLRGDGLSYIELGLCLAGSAIAAAVAIEATARLYRSERLAIST